MPTGVWKGVQHHQPSGKCKSKLKRAIISHLLGWLLSKRQEITSVGKGVEKREPLYNVGWNINDTAIMGKSMEVPQEIKK